MLGISMCVRVRVRVAHTVGVAQVPYTTVPFFWTMQHGKSVRYCGHALGFDDIVVEGDIGALAFVAYYVSTYSACPAARTKACRS
jgi:hypothetical protein